MKITGNADSNELFVFDYMDFRKNGFWEIYLGVVGVVCIINYYFKHLLMQ